MKKHLFWLLELLIWLMILFLVSNIIMFFKYNYKKNFNTYQIFLPDVDGLIIGSPVRLMGIQIGYINQLDIVGEDVYVKFIVNSPNVKIPKGSKATVEFSGLGGSKSLEIYKPTFDNNSSKFITPQPPKRIHDSLGLLNDMFDKLADIAYDISHFMDQVGIIRHKKTFNEIEEQNSQNNFLNISNNWIDKVQKQCNTFHKNLKTEKGK